ncbi:MAG: glycosyltransferase family 39 protein [Anaerolineae bacterium]|nr:glycosyltransferase family 39 protein [Anaerolineae bacterium]
MKKWHWVTCFALIILSTIVIRLGMMTRTPWEWDEPVYTQISQGVLAHGYPTIRADPNAVQGPYLFHPPFHFFLMAGWYQLIGDQSILAGRLLSVLIGTLVVAMTMLLVYTTTHHLPATAIAGILIGIDGWFTFSSSLVKLDSTALLLGLIGMYFLHQAQQRKHFVWGVLAGLFIGGAVIYKHVAIIFVVAAIIHWLLVRQQHMRHALVLTVSMIVVISYVLLMVLTWGNTYIQQSTNQLRRSTGENTSRGLNYGITETVSALYNTYWAFAGTLIIVGCGGLLALQAAVRPKAQPQIPTVLVSWCLAAGASLAAVQLRNPHYLVYLIVPASCIVAIALVNGLFAISQRVVRVSMAALIAFTGLHLLTLSLRAVVFDQTNAFLETQKYIMGNITTTATILSEEPICALVPNPCYRFGVNASEARVKSANPQYVVTYTSLTQGPPQTPAILGLIENGAPIFTTKGWKENIVVLRVPSIQ